MSRTGIKRICHSTLRSTFSQKWSKDRALFFELFQLCHIICIVHYCFHILYWLCSFRKWEKFIHSLHLIIRSEKFQLWCSFCFRGCLNWSLLNSKLIHHLRLFSKLRKKISKLILRNFSIWIHYEIVIHCYWRFSKLIYHSGFIIVHIFSNRINEIFSCSYRCWLLLFFFLWPIWIRFVRNFLNCIFHFLS